MKKIFVITLAFVCCFYAEAQKKPKYLKEAQNAYGDGKLDKAWEQIKLASSDSLYMNDPKTWFTRGQIAQSIALSKDSSYKSLIENPAKEAYDSYEKSISVDPKKKYSRDVDFQFLTLSPATANKAIEAFSAQKYDFALELFELNYKIESSPMFKSIDTANIYNCGLAATNAKNYDKAIEYLNKSISYNYGGSYSYSLLKNAYLGKADSANALITLKKAFEKYSTDMTIIVDLVNYYLFAGHAQEALNYLEMARTKEPNNTSFLFAEGTLYEKLGNQDSAKASYVKATEIDPKNFNAYYNLGVLFYNRAVKVFDQATNEKDDAKYTALQKQAEEYLKESVPYLEKAHEIDAKEKTCAETLKGLYFRLQMNDKLAKLKAEMGW